MVDCEIKFEQNPHGIYFAGQTVNGQVVLTMQKQKKVRAISLVIHGGSQCRWEEGMGKSSETFTGKEQFIKTNTYLVAPAANVHYDATPTVILPGIHTYNFSCALPHQLPTSFEGSKGHIRYTVRVALERPWKFDQTYRVAFTILKQMDLNYESPILRIASQGEVIKTFCCGPCKSPPMVIRASIPQTGYVPGQTVTIVTEISNQSKIKVEEVKFSLRKIIQYTSQLPRTKTYEEIVDVCEQRLGGLEGKQLSQMRQDLLIPAVPPTIANLSRVININYEIKVEVKVKAHINPIIRMPITIGTVPLVNYQQQQQPYPLMIAPAPVQNAAQPGMSTPSAPEPIIQPILNNRALQDMDMPPPTYEETVGAVDINDFDEDQHPIGSKPYAPRYPVYHNTTANANASRDGPGRSNEGP